MSRRVVTNSADEAQIERATDWQKDVERDLDAILATKRGRRFLRMFIFETCHIDRRSHVPGDPESTAFNEGARMVGQDLLERIKERDFARYLDMISEGQEDD